MAVVHPPRSFDRAQAGLWRCIPSAHLVLDPAQGVEGRGGTLDGQAGGRERIGGAILGPAATGKGQGSRISVGWEMHAACSVRCTELQGHDTHRVTPAGGIGILAAQEFVLASGQQTL